MTFTRIGEPLVFPLTLPFRWGSADVETDGNVGFPTSMKIRGVVPSFFFAKGCKTGVKSTSGIERLAF